MHWLFGIGNEHNIVHLSTRLRVENSGMLGGMSKGLKGMCNTGGGTDPSEGNTLVGGAFWERFNQREVDGQNQESIPRSDNSDSHQGM
jgi:hypothetical protein